MFTHSFRNWRPSALRGALGIAFGGLMLFWPKPMKDSLIFLFGIFVLLDGIFAVEIGIAWHRYFECWWAVLLEGLAGIVLGFLTFFWPGITALALLFFITAWAVIMGILRILVALQLRRVIVGEWSMFLSGLALAVLGILLCVFSAEKTIDLARLICIPSIVFGILEMIFAFHLRGWLSELETAVEISS